MSDDLSIDPLGLGISLREVDTSRPVLKDGKYRFTIKEVSRVPSAKTPGNFNLLAIISLAQQGETPDGLTIQPGFQLRRYMPLQQSPTDGAPDFKVDITRFICASFGLDPVADKERIPERCPSFDNFIGREIMATVKVTDDDTGKQNDIRGFSKVD